MKLRNGPENAPVTVEEESKRRACGIRPESERPLSEQQVRPSDVGSACCFFVPFLNGKKTPAPVLFRTQASALSVTSSSACVPRPGLFYFFGLRRLCALPLCSHLPACQVAGKHGTGALNKKFWFFAEFCCKIKEYFLHFYGINVIINKKVGFWIQCTEPDRQPPGLWTGMRDWQPSKAQKNCCFPAQDSVHQIRKERR